MKIIQSNLLNQFPNLTQGFTTKDNGNIAFHVNDSKIKVIQNHKLVAIELSYDVARLIHMKQVHKTEVKVVQGSDNFYNSPTCDALITNKKNTPLMVMVADCSPLLFYDSKKEVIAVVHAGRAGAFNDIVKETLKSFRDDFTSAVKDIYVCVGPSIGECCYEVGSEIYDEAKELKLDFAISQKQNSYFLNISKILHKQLLQNGIKKENIEFSSVCTACTTENFFSYRAEGETGRFAGLLMLKETSENIRVIRGAL
ncbi:peptidoglycan editing factor PgeF [Sulfurimonas sp. SAG-AH-194-L11]|nr:peptidoglycan editing factor PgeF [Sulfurimonas sp. SAG-AH-194-L11]MDF1876468.1 peptidoglycan editing factor PgeF [Sulfurimonas sp. SAG-AH-194-L11]